MVNKEAHQVSPVKLTFTEELSTGIYLIGFKRTFHFKAGQVIGIAMEENGPRRLYSICSGEQEEEIHILYKVVDEGYLTPSAVRPGNRRNHMDHRSREESLPGTEDPAVWIANRNGNSSFLFHVQIVDLGRAEKAYPGQPLPGTVSFF
jgi:ferredoxin--NADP+ reductase